MYTPMRLQVSTSRHSSSRAPQVEVAAQEICRTTRPVHSKRTHGAGAGVACSASSSPSSTRLADTLLKCTDNDNRHTLPCASSSPDTLSETSEPKYSYSMQHSLIKRTFETRPVILQAYAYISIYTYIDIHVYISTYAYISIYTCNSILTFENRCRHPPGIRVY